MRTILIFSLMAAGIFSLGNSGGRAFVARQGNTGAPGDNREVCQSCHNSAAIQVTVGIQVQDENGDPVTEYVPGRMYDVIVKVEPQRGTPSGYGFQMVALNAPLDMIGDPVNNWIDSATNVKLVTLNTGRQYAEHDGVSRSSEFKVKWEAPSQGTGQVSMYAAGNGVNLNGGTSGDGASTAKISLSEAPPVNVAQRLDLEGVFIGPNPAVEYISIDRTDRVDHPWQIRIFQTNGQMLLRNTLPAGQDRMDLSLSGLQPGLYILHISEGGRDHAVRLVKN